MQQRQWKTPDQTQKQGDSKRPSSGKGGSGSKFVENKEASRQPATMQAKPKDSKTTSKILETLQREATYCLTGSSLFWRTGSEGMDSGT